MDPSQKVKGDERLTRIMAFQYTKATREPDEFVKFAIDGDDPQTWHVLVRNLSGDNDEFVGGEYLFEMWAPPQFPYEPPKFTALTPNGVYEIGKTVCISIGEYHKDNNRAQLGMAGFAKELANGIMCWKALGHGINIIASNTSLEDKKRLARSSPAWNMKHYPEIVVRLESAFTTYSAKWDMSQVNSELAKRIGAATRV